LTVSLTKELTEEKNTFSIVQRERGGGDRDSNSRTEGGDPIHTVAWETTGKAKRERRRKEGSGPRAEGGQDYLPSNTSNNQVIL
jgi:hypothetical protein